ncbi:MAG: hypothetical protein IJ251_07040 [Oscillospiraceae bacterium]|nr:hypothetical protein [Oscillospiraceae bacterium]
MNNIRLAKKYSQVIDEVYAETAKTAAIESDKGMMRETANAAEVMVPMLAMDGMAKYSRNDGYVKGNVSLTWTTMKFDYERGRRFEVDVLDNAESSGTAFGMLAGEFIRTKAVPELDAVRFASLSDQAGDRGEGVLSSGDEVIAALRAAVSSMDGSSVPEDQRVLFITSRLMGMIEDMDENKSRSVLGGFEKVVKVPQTRFSTAVKLNDGTTSGEEAGGFAPDGADINFMIVHKPAVIVFTRNMLSKIIPPELNPTSDNWVYAYRSYAMTHVYANKSAGVYVHSVE